MKRLLLITAITLAAVPAYANPVLVNSGGGDPAQAQVYGDGSAAAAARSSSAATAVQGQRQGQSQSATGGNARATGGSARASGGTSNVSVNNNSGGGGDGGGGGRRAPDVYLPSIGGGGMDCPTVGFGAAGSGLGGGGGFGPSWISSDCNHRKVADLVAHLYGEDVARSYVEQNIEGVREAIKASAAARPVYQHPAWCRASNGTWLRDLAECGNAP